VAAAHLVHTGDLHPEARHLPLQRHVHLREEEDDEEKMMQMKDRKGGGRRDGRRESVCVCVYVCMCVMGGRGYWGEQVEESEEREEQMKTE